MKRVFVLFSLISICVLNFIQGQDSPVNPVTDTLSFPPPEIYKINTGYSERFEKDIASSIFVIKRDDLRIIPDDIITTRLQGLVPGLTVRVNGVPGSSPEILIRGFDLYRAIGPLYIVDGVPLTDISMLNPDDVENVVVLKDAGASSVYGARAMNGIIIINTKRGYGGLRVSYETSFGWTMPGQGPSGKLLNTAEYAQLQWKVYENDNYDEVHPIYGLSTNPQPEIPEWAGNTDWYAEMTRKASFQRHQLAVRGGNDHAWFYGSFGSCSEDGLLIHTYSKKYHLRFNSEWKFMDDRVKAGENFTVTIQKSNHASTGEQNPFLMGPYRSQSIIPVYMDRTVPGYSHVFQPGEYGGTGISQRLGNSTNVVADLTRNKDDYNFNMGFFGNAWLDVEILKGLHFRTNFGGNYSTGYEVDYSEASYENSENFSIDMLNENSNFIRNQVWTHMLQFNNIGSIHNVNIIAGYETVKSDNGRGISASKSGYYSDNYSFRTISNGNNLVEAASYYFSGMPLKSFFFKANYDVLEKFMMEFSIRRDQGFSSYEPGMESRAYVSLSGGWRLSKERFMGDLSWLNDLVVRGSYGNTGNIYSNWENSVILDLGVDGAFFHNHLYVNFDWYHKQSSDLLMAVEGTSEPPRTIYLNSGSIENHGIDLRIGYENKWNIFGFNANLFLSKYKNNINSITDDIEYFDSNETRIGTVSRYQSGHSAGEFFGYQVTGLFANSGEVTDAPQQNGAEPGFFRYKNVNQSDNEINPDDRTFIGSPHPDFTMGLNLGFSIANFDLSTLIFWNQGNEILNFTRWWTDFWPSYQGQKSKQLLYKSWTEDNPNASVPKASNKSNFSTNTQISSYYVEDGSYLRMKSLQLGYSFGSEKLKKNSMSSLRIYVQALNVFTLTRYTGLDPEIPGLSGIDMGGYPNARQFLFGLQLEI